jgi:hypothetical protein
MIGLVFHLGATQSERRTQGPLPVLHPERPQDAGLLRNRLSGSAETTPKAGCGPQGGGGDATAPYVQRVDPLETAALAVPWGGNGPVGSMR